MTFNADKLIDEIYEEYSKYEHKYKIEDKEEFLQEFLALGYDTGTSEHFINNTNYVHLEQDGGEGGGSEYCRTVFTFKGRYYSIEYSYYSYDGYDNITADNICEVEPKQVLVTQYYKI